jgi:hypothetical protein
MVSKINIIEEYCCCLNLKLKIFCHRQTSHLYGLLDLEGADLSRRQQDLSLQEALESNTRYHENEYGPHNE